MSGERRLGGQSCGIDLRHTLFEDVAEAFKVVKVCGAELLRHAAFDFFREFLSCCENAVDRGDGESCEVFLFVEDCGGDSCGTSILHTHGLGAVVVK